MQIVNQALAMSGQPWVPSGNAKPEREMITHAHEKIFAFSQNLRIGIVVMLFITSFFPPWTGGQAGECEPVVCGLAKHVGFWCAV